MMKDSTAFNSKGGYIPPWKSSPALCPVTLSQPFNSCQGFITQRQHTVLHSMHGSFMCCVFHMLTWAGRQMCQPRMIAMHTGGLNTHFVFIFLCFALMKTHTPPIVCFQSAPSLCVAELLGYCFSPHFSCCSCGVFIRWLQDLDPFPLPQIFCSITTRIELL